MGVHRLGCLAGALGLAAALTASHVLNPNPVLPAGLPILMVAGWLGLLVTASVRLIRGPRRGMALASLLMGIGADLVLCRPRPDGDAAAV